jgi:hypothetical protein
MKTNELNLPDELFDNTAEQESYPDNGNETQTGAATDLDDIETDTTDDEDGDLADDDDE